MIESIKITSAFKKIDGKWKQFNRSQIEKEEDIDGMVFKTISGNMFRINMRKNVAETP
jgi:hypothetical protein